MTDAPVLVDDQARVRTAWARGSVPRWAGTHGDPLAAPLMPPPPPPPML